MTQLIKSMSYALQGIASCFAKEQNFRIHTSAIVAVCFFGVLLKFNIHYWCIVILCFGLVLGMELMNSAVEKLCDFVEPNQNEKIKIIKDMSAGAVLIQAISALIVACIIGLNLYELWKVI
jgi:diacylglycerol kinase